jgi:hypothetical protein
MISSSCDKLVAKVGSIIKVRQSIDELTDRLVADPMFQSLLGGVSFGLIKMHSIKLFNIALSEYSYKMDVSDYMVKSHMRLFAEHGLSAVHFDRLLEHFVKVITNAGWPAELIDEAVNNIVPLRDAFDEGHQLYGPTSRNAGKYARKMTISTVKKSMVRLA